MGNLNGSIVSWVEVNQTNLIRLYMRATGGNLNSNTGNVALGDTDTSYDLASYNQDPNTSIHYEVVAIYTDRIVTVVSGDYKVNEQRGISNLRIWELARVDLIGIVNSPPTYPDAVNLNGQYLLMVDDSNFPSIVKVQQLSAITVGGLVSRPNLEVIVTPDPFFSINVSLGTGFMLYSSQSNFTVSGLNVPHDNGAPFNEIGGTATLVARKLN